MKKLTVFLRMHLTRPLRLLLMLRKSWACRGILINRLKSSATRIYSENFWLNMVSVRRKQKGMAA